MAAMKKDDSLRRRRLAPGTHIDDYLVHMRRRDAAARERRRLPPRTEPEAPRFMLSTFPYAALLAVFAMMTVLILIAAWPGREHAVPQVTRPSTRRARRPRAGSRKPSATCTERRPGASMFIQRQSARGEG